MKYMALLVLLAVVCSAGAAAMPAAATTLDLNMEKISIEKIAATSQITVSLHNGGADALRLWRDSNSWGAARWRIIRVSRDGKLHVYFQDPDQIFTRNVRAFDELPAAKSQQVVLDVNEHDWLPRNERKTFVPGEIIIVIYDVPASTEAQEDGVWYGVTAAKAIVQ